jgi:CTP:molybdopterin cytidylyltransferase MocA
LARVCDIIEAHRNDDWDRPMLLSAAAALAASKRHFDIAEALLNLDDYWISKINDFEFD